MRCKELLNKLSESMPLEYAMEWDNPGLLVGRADRKVSKVVIALDGTSEVIDKAIQSKADLIITHHPLIFSSMKSVVETDIVGKRVLKMVENNITYIAMHTNYDVAKGCMADITAEMMGIKGKPLECTGIINRTPIGVGKVGDLSKGISLEKLCDKVKDKFSLPYVIVHGSDIAPKTIKRIAISPGSGKDMYGYAVEAGAEVLITGDITHHEGLDAKEAGICIIDAGHYGLEHVFIKDMAKRVKNITGLKDNSIITYYPEYPTAVY